MKITLPIVISCLALLLGCINFYWIHLKNSKILNLLYVDRITEEMQPEFVIINSGERDLLITKFRCSFGNIEKDNQSFVPAQRFESENDSWLVPSGKGFRYKVSFTEKFSPSFAKIGKAKTIDKKLLYIHDMYVDISWVEMDGTYHSKSIKMIKYGFNEEGKIMYRAPTSFRKSINLYK